MIDCPFISQLLPDANGRLTGANRCGPAGVTSALAHFGKVPATQDAMLAITREEHNVDGTPINSYTSFQDAIVVSQAHGIVAQAVYSWQAIYNALDTGAPVMLLVDNSALLPKRYPDGPGWLAHHLILLTGYDGHVFYANDPLVYPVLSPAQYTVPSVIHAVAGIGSVQAVAFWPPAPDPVVVSAPAPEETPVDDTERQAMQAQIDGLNGVTAEMGNQVAALHEEIRHVRDDLLARAVEIGRTLVQVKRVSARQYRALAAELSHLAD